MDKEIARRNYALTAETFDCDYLLRISCGDEVVVTVEGMGDPDDPEEFRVYNGTGLDDQDLEDINQIVNVFQVGDSVSASWREAARWAYVHALGKLMTQDAREEKQAYRFDGLFH